MNKRPVDIGNPFDKIDWHHCVLTKYDVMGLPAKERDKINVPWNMLKIAHEAHINSKPPIHQEAALLMYRIYGRDVVREWFYHSINWKSGHPPFEIP